MRIWICQIGENPTFELNGRKMRNSFLAAELARRGHQVVWWASQFNHNKKAWRTEVEMDPEPLNNISIKYLRGCGYKKNISLRRFLDHRLIAKRFSKLSLDEPQPDIIVASIPTYDLAYKASQYSVKRDIPLIVDVRDQWPEIFVKYSPRFLRIFVKAALFYDFWIFRKALERSYAVVSMMETILNWSFGFMTRTKGSQDQVFYLGCEPNPEFNLQKKLSERKAGRLQVTFVGTFGSQNNPMVIVAAAKLLSEHPIDFVFGGDGVFFNQAVSFAAGLKNCKFLGWLNNDQLNEVLLNADIAICPTPPRVDVFPNKVFSYFANGLPVITSTTGDLNQLIQTRDIGSSYVAESAKDLAIKILEYYLDADKLERQTKNVYRFYVENCEAEKIYSRYVDFLVEVVARHKKI